MLLYRGLHIFSLILMHFIYKLHLVFAHTCICAACTCSTFVHKEIFTACLWIRADIYNNIICKDCLYTIAVCTKLTHTLEHVLIIMCLYMCVL